MVRADRVDVTKLPEIATISSAGWLGGMHDQERGSYDVGSSSSALHKRSPAGAAEHRCAKLREAAQNSAHALTGSGGLSGRLRALAPSLAQPP